MWLEPVRIVLSASFTSNLFHKSGIALIVNMIQIFSKIGAIMKSNLCFFVNISKEMHCKKVSCLLSCKELCWWMVFPSWTRNSHSLPFLSFPWKVKHQKTFLLIFTFFKDVELSFSNLIDPLKSPKHCLLVIPTVKFYQDLKSKKSQK